MRTFGLIACIAAIQLSAPSNASADDIGAQLQKHAPKIVSYLNEQDIKTVGVLKFRVKKPGKKSSDSVGSLNSLLADRLEVGLILANPFDEERQLNIIKNASDQVVKIKGANHLTQRGREAFFGPKYTLAWGDHREPANAFLTGVVQVHDDNQRVSVGILCFNHRGGDLVRACDVFEADLDAASLGEMGESFVLRGAFDEGNAKLSFKEEQSRQQEIVRAEAAKVKSKQAPFPLADPAAPVKLEITYDGRPVQVELRDGEAFVPEPKEGQKVEFTLTRNANAVGKLGIVLKVNGENTLYRQTVRDIDCARWILSPEQPRAVVRGYQVRGKNTMEQFKVLSSAESAEREVDYGRNVGQIQLTVFAELSDVQQPPRAFILDDDEEDLIAMLRGVQPSKPAANLSELKGQIRSAARGHDAQTRGLIARGQGATSVVRAVTFNPNPTPIMSTTITYYAPK